jgi:hypothetical protein
MEQIWPQRNGKKKKKRKKSRQNKIKSTEHYGNSSHFRDLQKRQAPQINQKVIPCS